MSTAAEPRPTVPLMLSSAETWRRLPFTSTSVWSGASPRKVAGRTASEPSEIAGCGKLKLGTSRLRMRLVSPVPLWLMASADRTSTGTGEFSTVRLVDRVPVTMIVGVFSSSGAASCACAAELKARSEKLERSVRRRRLRMACPPVFGIARMPGRGAYASGEPGQSGKGFHPQLCYQVLPTYRSATPRRSGKRKGRAGLNLRARFCKCNFRRSEDYIFLAASAASEAAPAAASAAPEAAAAASPASEATAAASEAASVATAAASVATSEAVAAASSAAFSEQAESAKAAPAAAAARTILRMYGIP